MSILKSEVRSDTAKDVERALHLAQAVTEQSGTNYAACVGAAKELIELAQRAAGTIRKARAGTAEWRKEQLCRWFVVVVSATSLAAERDGEEDAAAIREKAARSLVQEVHSVCAGYAALNEYASTFGEFLPRAADVGNYVKLLTEMARGTTHAALDGTARAQIAIAAMNMAREDATRRSQAVNVVSIEDAAEAALNRPPADPEAVSRAALDLVAAMDARPRRAKRGA